MLSDISIALEAVLLALTDAPPVVTTESIEDVDIPAQGRADIFLEGIDPQAAETFGDDGQYEQEARLAVYFSVTGAPAARFARMSALLTAFAAAIEADPTLGGVVAQVDSGGVQFGREPATNGRGVLSADVSLIVQYFSDQRVI